MIVDDRAGINPLNSSLRRNWRHLTLPSMRIAKPILLVSTPIGVAWGFYEAYKLAGGLVWLMAALVGVMVVAAITVVRTIKREKREQEQRQAQSRTQEF